MLKRWLILLLGISLALPVSAQDASDTATNPALAEGRWALAIHGGAGTILRENMTDAQEAAYEAALGQALDAGSAVLADGGTAMEAVAAVITRLEDDPKFNAGRGAVYTWDGTNELDAAVMDGRTRQAGAVTGVKRIKNPILLARAVMADGRHVFLSGAGAEIFAENYALETAAPEWFETEARKNALERMKARELSALDVDHKYGTVGAVALDQSGNMAAGTSTGGLTGKRWGRIGDAPIIGAGTYADNRACAVSATGAREYFIRVGVAHEICARLRLTDVAPQQIGDDVMAEVKLLGGDGGVILVTPLGEALFSFNTPGMYRGRATSEGMREIAIFAEE